MHRCRQNEKLFQASVKDEQDVFLKENEMDYQYNILEREVDAKTKVYQKVLEKHSEIDVEGALIKNNVRIVERAGMGVKVVPNWRYNLLIAFALGMILGCAGAFFLEYLDKTLKTPEEVESYLGLPVLAIVPAMKKDMIRAPYAPPELIESGEVK